MHVLLENAKKYISNKLSHIHDGYEYSDDGYWVSVEDGSPLVQSEALASLSTKKEDVETGEDHKGE